MPRFEGMAPAACPVSDIIARFGDKWSILALIHLSHSAHGDLSLHHAIGDIPRRVLTVTLRKLEADGLITRHAAVPHRRPASVTYVISPLGQSLKSGLNVLAGWAVDNRERIDDARVRLPHAPTKVVWRRALNRRRALPNSCRVGAFGAH